MEKQNKAWIFIIEDDSKCNTNYIIPEESILVDDLEGNLYRLGLRLEEIQDEIGDKLRGDNIHLDEHSNYSVSPSMLHGTDSKRSYDGECSETETTKAENNIYSDDDINDVNDEILDWKPATEDATQFGFYKKLHEKHLGGLDPIYLSRCSSAPALCNLQSDIKTRNAVNHFIQDLPKDNVELSNTQGNLGDSCVKKRKSRKSPTHAIETLTLKKSPPSGKSTLVQSHSNVALASTEDSGFLEGSHHPSQQTFPSRNATSPLRSHSRIDEVDATCGTARSLGQGDALEKSTGEQYRQRLHSLRNYIRTKRMASNSQSAAENSENSCGSLSRGTKTGDHNCRYSSRLRDTENDIPKLNSGCKVNHSRSSTTESMLSSAIKSVVEEKEKKMPSSKHKEEKPSIQRQDIDTLREEMRGVKDIVLDLKNSLTSPYVIQPQDPTPSDRFHDNGERRSSNNSSLGRDEFDLSRERSNELLYLPNLQNKLLEMLEKLNNKLDDISEKLRPSSATHRHSPSPENATHVNADRLDSPSRYSHVSSYYYQLGEENLAEINRRPNADTCEIGRRTEQGHAHRNTENLKELDRRCESCDKFVPSRSQEPQSWLGSRTNDMVLNQHRVSTPLNPAVYGETNAHTAADHRIDESFNDSVTLYHDRWFGKVGERLNELTLHVKECKENEEKQARKEILNQHNQLVEFIREKLETLSAKVEEQEKKIPSDTKPLSAYVISCPLCGRVGVHQHGGHIFNGYHIIEQHGNGGLRTSYMRPQGHAAVSPTRQSDHSFKIHSTPKNEGESGGERSSSPIVYHHYHTVYSPHQKEYYNRQSNGGSTGYVDAAAAEVILTNRVYDSLEKASLAAMNMETLSKKMLRGVTTDLFNCGPNEF